MKISPALPLAFMASAAILCGCQSPSASQPTLRDRLANPLYQERYEELLAERMAEMVIQKDPLLDDPRKKDLEESTRLRAIKKAQYSNDLKREGLDGFFVEIKEPSEGEVLLLRRTLFLSPDFKTSPGPSLHIYLTTVVDPRLVEKFPDATAIDLGEISTPFGAQQYALPAAADEGKLVTAVLYDTRLERLYGIAQLARIPH